MGGSSRAPHGARGSKVTYKRRWQISTISRAPHGARGSKVSGDTNIGVQRTSRSAWSAWIERSFLGDIYNITEVALRMERVDRKRPSPRTINKVGGRAPHGARGSKEWRNGKGELNEPHVALRMERVDRKHISSGRGKISGKSRSAWSAWIERALLNALA